MAKQLFVNNFTSTFVANVNASASTGSPGTELGYGILQLNSGASSFLTAPTGGDYYILTAYKRSGSVESNVEVMKVTAVDNSVINECRITVARAQEGTPAQAYVPGDYISLRVTKGGLSNMAQPADLAAKQDLIGTISGLVKGAGANALTAAVAETDYVTPSGAGTLQNKTFASPYLTGTTRIGYDLANFIQGTGAASGSMPTLSAQGSDTNINLGLAGKGSGGVTLWSQGVIGFSVSNPVSAVNYLAAVGGATGGGVTLGAAGSDSNVSVAIMAKGTGSVQAWSNGAAVYLASAPVSAVNYLGFTAATTGNAVSLSALGADTNIGLTLGGKGSGRVASSSVLQSTKGFLETRTAMGANDIDLSTGNVFTKTISGATTLTVSNTPSSGTVATFILDLTDGGSATITWWSGVKWVGGTAPTLTTAGRDVLGFFTHDGGTTWTGLVLGKDVK